MLCIYYFQAVENYTNATCNFWDPTADSKCYLQICVFRQQIKQSHFIAGYFGDWSTRGCVEVNETKDIVMCECDHLTNFAILLVSMDHSCGCHSNILASYPAIPAFFCAPLFLTASKKTAGMAGYEAGNKSFKCNLLTGHIRTAKWHHISSNEDQENP